MVVRRRGAMMKGLLIGLDLTTGGDLLLPLGVVWVLERRGLRAMLVTRVP